VRTLPQKKAMFDELVGGKTFLVIDIETTSVPATQNKRAHLRVVAVACVPLTNGIRRTPHYWLVNPGAPIDAASSGHHGLTDKDVAKAADTATVLDKLTALVNDYPGAPIVCHNTGFDIGVLRSEAERVGSLFFTRWVYDTMYIGHRLGVAELATRPGLRELVERYGVSTRKGTRTRKAVQHANQTAEVFAWLVAEAAAKSITTWQAFDAAVRPYDTITQPSSFPGRLHKVLPPTIPGQHYQEVHSQRLGDQPSDTELDEWALEVAGCVSLRCSYIVEKVRADLKYADDILPRLTGLLYECPDPGMMGTLLGGMEPILALLGKEDARNWYKQNHAALKVAPLCAPEAACPWCVAELPCPQDVTYQLIAKRAVAFDTESLTSRKARDDLFKEGNWRKMDTWPRNGMPELAGFMMWLVATEYQRAKNVRRFREVLGQCEKRDLHLVEPRLAYEMGRYWAGQGRNADIETMVSQVLGHATTDPAFTELDMWFNVSHMPAVKRAAAPPKPKRTGPPKRNAARIESRPADRKHEFRYQVY
jgi:DNA polymerase III epsilon subunit-like protein